jgi:pimeloyl-ACP methyl ester carboxylesterase
MSQITASNTDPRPSDQTGEHRARLLRGVPVVERRLDVAGIPTAVLEGGEGPPVVLLHGPGESAVNWRWTFPGLVTTHRVIAPDLPAHGASGTGDQPPDADVAIEWLERLIEATCDEPPTVVGHVLGGAIAARFAAHRPDRLRGLVLVDSLGLGRFRPSPRFALTFLGFIARPRERSYERFMGQCAYDLDKLRRDMGEDWSSFVAYNVAMAASGSASQAGRLFRKAGLPRIRPVDLDRIDVPTTLIWGREDRANRLRVAKRAHTRHRWPLHVIDGAADDPARDQPVAFVEALQSILATTV